MNLSYRALIFSVILMIVGCTAWSKNSSLTVSFPIGTSGATVTTKFLVRERQTYAFTLRYAYKENDQADRAQVWKLAGGSFRESPGKWLEPGAALRIRVTISKQEAGGERLITEKVVERPRLTSWGTANLDAELVAATLDPGNYAVTVVSLDEAPSFVGAHTSLFIGRAYRGK